MREYRGPDGRPRIWFKPSEIEDMMEDELRRAGLYPSPDEPAVDVEKLLEGHLKVKLDQYAELEETVLGLTTFAHGQKPKVEINRDLTGTAFDHEEVAMGSIGRWRATLAHEAAHVIMHRLLFELPPSQGNLFAGTNGQASARAESVMRCFKRDIGLVRGHWEWQEVQANKGMAALLMPRRLVTQITRETLPIGLGGLPEAGSREAERMATRISELFRVSRQAATIRVADLGLVVRGGQQQMV